MRLAESLAGFELLLNKNEKSSVSFNNFNITDIYLGLFKRFSVFDNKNLYPNIHKLLEVLFERIENKP
jgi:hypothetical protein